MSKTGIHLHNTMTQRLEQLEPLEPGHVRMYVCGLTTYDHAHAGHARMCITFDVLARFLRARGLKVTFVRNVTDIDDKIIQRAVERGEHPLELSRRMSQVNAAELHAIGCMDPDEEPRVSEHIPEIIALISELVARGAAYAAPTSVGTDVYFSVRKFPGYGKLSHRRLDELVAGARVEPGEGKRDSLDFALWKASPEGTVGWESPWGRGRPGWHIECSAMAATALSPHFDLHGGGLDLVFPHHENEIAQSESAWGAPFARLWVHNGFVQVDAEKMSKSLGNFVTIEQILARNDAEALRYFLLGAHYRGPVNFEVDTRPDGRIVFPGLDEAERRVDYLYAARESLLGAPSPPATPIAGDDPVGEVVREAPARVLAALDEDLNTSVALSVIGEVARLANDMVQEAAKQRKNEAARARALRLAAAAVDSLQACCKPLGLMQAAPEEYRSRTRERRLSVRGLDEANIQARVDERARARAAKDYARSDAIRAELLAMGVEIQDAPGTGATRWTVAV